MNTEKLYSKLKCRVTERGVERGRCEEKELWRERETESV